MLDPENTLIKLISTTGGHARSNIYSQMVRLYRASIVPFPGIVRQDYIGMSTDDMTSAITRIAIKEGESGTAALRGFHPTPRRIPHPLLGDHTFSIAILDEAEGIPGGVWKGVDNLAATGNVAIYAATNPLDISSEFALRAEPLEGWAMMDEDATEWEGREGWLVIRLDPSKSENIVSRKVIFKGLMEYEPWLDLESKGPGSPDRDAFGHGRYPTEAVEYQIFSPNITNRMVGSFNFISPETEWASFDAAYAEGGDRPILTTGKFGMADRWYDRLDVEHVFDRPKWCIWAEQQFAIKRQYHEDEPNVILMGRELIEICTRLHVAPENFIMDRTGSGVGIHDFLKLEYGGAITGLEWGSGATDLKIMEEDSKLASEQFYGLISEMWFAAKQWAEFDCLKVSPNIQTRRLLQQLSNRKYKFVTKALRKTEGKDIYKKRPPHESPDEADSFIMSTQLFRQRTHERPAMLPPKRSRERKSLWDFTPPEREVKVPGYSWVK